MAKRWAAWADTLSKHRHLDVLYAARRLQDGAATNRRLDDVGADVDESDGRGTGSHHSKSPVGRIAGHETPHDQTPFAVKNWPHNRAGSWGNVAFNFEVHQRHSISCA